MSAFDSGGFDSGGFYADPKYLTLPSNVGSLVCTGNAVALRRGYRVSCNAASVLFSNIEVDVRKNSRITPAVFALQSIDFSVAARKATILSGGVSSNTVSILNIDTRVNRRTAGDLANLTITGNNVDFSIKYPAVVPDPTIELALSELSLFELAAEAAPQKLELALDVSGLTLAGQVIGAYRSYNSAPVSSGLVLTGQAAGVNRQYHLVNDVSALVITTNPGPAIASKHLTADVSALSLSGIPVDVRRTALLIADTWASSLQSSDTAFVLNKRLNADVHGLVLTGHSVNSVTKKRLLGNVASVLVQSSSTDVLRKYALSVEVSANTFEFYGIDFSGVKSIVAETFGFALNVNQVALVKQRAISVGNQILQLNSTQTSVRFTRRLTADKKDLVFNQPAVGFRKFSLSASGMSLFIQEQDTNLYKQARLNLTNVFSDLGASSTVLKTARKILPQVNNAALYSSLVDLVKRIRLITETQELIGSLTESQVIYGRVLLPIKSDLVQTSNESVFLLKRYLNALDSSNHLEVQEALLKYVITLRLNVYDLNLNDSNTWFMRSDLPEGFFKLVRQLESRQSIRTLEEFRLVRELEHRQAFRTPEENRATIMESP